MSQEVEQRASGAPLGASDNRTIVLDGSVVANLRRCRGLSQEQLSHAAQGPHPLSVATIKRLERGSPVYLETARRVAELLGSSVESLRVQENAPDIASVRDEDRDRSTVGVAVLTFRAVGEDQSSLNLAQGLVEDLTTRLSCWWFPVICRASTWGYGDSSERATIASDLHVGYFIDGSVQRQGQEIRVHCRLLNARSGVLIWAQEYNRAYADLFALQDEVTADIVESVGRRLLLLESKRSEQRDPSDLQAWELNVQGACAFHQRNPQSNQRARELLRRAVGVDAGSAASFFFLALTYQQELINQWSTRPNESLQGLLEVSLQFERLHASDPRADIVGAYRLLYGGRREAAKERLLRAIESGPNLPLAYSLLGQTLAMGNEADAAIEQFEIATRLSPRDGDLWSLRTATALAHFVAGRLPEALQWAECAVQDRPDIPFTFGTLAAVAALAGDVPKAKRAVGRMLALHPKMSISGFAAITASTDPRIAKRYMEGLRLAGFH
jgi:adenylate cyclase